MQIQYVYVGDWDSDKYELYNLRLLKDLPEDSEQAERAYDSLPPNHEPTVFSKFGGLRLGAAT